MFLVREVLNCKPGKVGALVKKFKALGAVMERMDLKPFRLCTDVAGAPFWTLIAETEAESIDAFGAMEERVMSDEEAQQAMSGYHDLVESGRREIYKIQA